MQILLCNPPAKYCPTSGKPAVYIPIGLLSIAAILEKTGHVVRVYDTKADYNIVREKKYTRLGDSYATIKKNIKKIHKLQKIDIVGIGNPFTVYMHEAMEVARAVKAVDKNIPVVVGGPHASVAPQDFLKDSNIDYVCMGEGEFFMLELLQHFKGKKKIEEIKGLAYRKGKKIIINPPRPLIQNLDVLPFPAYHLMDMEKYFRGIFTSRSEFSSRAVPMVTSRGCPFNCCFCSVHLHMGKAFRSHSPEYVSRYIKLLVQKYGVKLIHFEDDNLTFDKKRCEKIFDKLIDNKIRIGWDTPNGVRADRLDKKLLIKAKKSGCLYLVIGIESGNQKVLD